MKKVIIILVSLLILLVVLFYGYKAYQGSANVTCEEGFRFNPATEECIPSSQSLEDKEFVLDDLTINIPDTDLSVVLAKNSDGLYEGSTKSSNGSEYVLIDPKLVLDIDTKYTVVPFFLSSNGSGQFAYVALINNGTREHTSSVYVDDRTTIKDITVKENLVLVNYLTRSTSQSFSESPKVPAQLVLSIQDKTLSEQMRLENSTYEQIEYKAPAPQSSVQGDFAIKGAVPGFWYFEAIAGYRILDDSLQVISSGTVEALSDWMTERRVPFEVKLNTGSFGYTGKATIIIESENVQGGDEGELKVKRLKIPVTIK